MLGTSVDSRPRYRRWTSPVACLGLIVGFAWCTSGCGSSGDSDPHCPRGRCLGGDAGGDAGRSDTRHDGADGRDGALPDASEGPLEVTISPADVQLMTGASTDLSVDVADAAGDPVDTFQAQWQTSNSDVVLVDPTGHLSAASTGSATITARVSAGTASGRAQIEATVAPAAVDSVDIVPVDEVAEVGQRIDFDARCLDFRDSEIDDVAARWTSSNEAVATVAADSGLAEAIGAGEATLTARCRDISASTSLTVQPRPIERLKLSHTYLRMTVEESIQVTVKAYDSTGGQIDLSGRQVDWTTLDDTVATVTSTGLVDAVSPGETLITVTVGSRSIDAEVTVE